MIGAALAAAALALPSTANATPEQDQQFYDLLWANGMAVGPYAVGNAHTVCADVWAGVHPEDEARILYIQDSGLWSLQSAREFVAISIIVYCPPSSGTVLA